MVQVIEEMAVVGMRGFQFKAISELSFEMVAFKSGLGGLFASIKLY